MNIHETVRQAQDTLTHFRGMYMRDSLHDYCRQFVDYMRPYNNIRMEQDGRLWWTASEKPLVPPKSLGEMCLTDHEERLHNIMAHYHNKFPDGIRVWMLKKGNPIDEARTLRLAIYHKEKA